MDNPSEHKAERAQAGSCAPRQNVHSREGVAVPCALWNLSSPIRDWTRALSTESANSTGPPGNSQNVHVSMLSLKSKGAEVSNE